MKKILFAVLASTFATALMADYVYDYKASIKRINPTYKVRTVDKAKAVTTSYSVVSDTLSGYIVVPACVACAEGGVSDSIGGFTNDKTYAYIIRKGNKYKKNVLKTKPVMSSAIFGAYVNNTSKKTDPQKAEAPLASIKDAKKAWMYLAYASHDAGKNDMLSSEVVLTKVNPTDLYYGFLGFDNKGIVTIVATGFGTAKIMSKAEVTDLGFCGDNTTPGWSCQYINTISGTLIGLAEYEGPCGITPMWNLCYSEDKNTASVNDAVISGTWTLKFNKSLSAVAADEKEAAILKKLKVTANDIVLGSTFDINNVKP